MQFFVLKSGGSSPMKFDEVKELIAIFEKSDMGEMEIKLDGDSVHLGRNASFSVSNSEKEKVMINEDYWVDILQGIQEVNNKYVEYNFTYENAVNK